MYFYHMFSTLIFRKLVPGRSPVRAPPPPRMKYFYILYYLEFILKSCDGANFGNSVQFGVTQSNAPPPTHMHLFPNI